MREIRYWTSSQDKHADVWMRRLGLSPDKFHLVYDARQPDYLIVTEHIYFERLSKADFQRLYRADRLTLFWAGECISPDLNLFDYAMTYDKGLTCGDRVVRRPVLSLFGDFAHERLDVAPQDARDILHRKTRFCNFIYSNPDAHPHRDWLFHTLTRYKAVDSLGPHLHNCDNETSRWVKDFENASVEMKRPYKFSISSENARFMGYTSEKILTSFLARSVPIYWGNPDVENEFNPKAFLNANALTEQALVRRIRELDEDDAAWVEMVSQPPMTAEQSERSAQDEQHYRQFMEDLFTRPLASAIRRPEGYWPANYRRTLFGATARQVTRTNRLYKALGRETRLARWILDLVRRGG